MPEQQRCILQPAEWCAPVENEHDRSKGFIYLMSRQLTAESSQHAYAANSKACHPSSALRVCGPSMPSDCIYSSSVAASAHRFVCSYVGCCAVVSSDAQCALMSREFHICAICIDVPAFELVII